MDRFSYEQDPWNRGPDREEPWERAPERRPGVRRTNRIILIVFAALFLILVSTSLLLRYVIEPRVLPEPAPEPEVALPQPELPRFAPGAQVALELVSAEGRESLSYQDIYQKNIPSVVTIRTSRQNGYGVGTGIVLTEDGYILTNSHVIEDGYAVTVVLNSGTEMTAELVGRDGQTDLAVLKIRAQNLVPAELGTSDELAVGDEALAIGNPLGEQLRGTLTNGIISAINRDVMVSGRVMTLIQTTAALNEGNSGGPLINLKGQVVGINTIKMMSNYSTIEGLGFAIPTTLAKPIVEELIAQGYLTDRLTIGLYGRPAEYGVYVESVIDGTGAADAGLQSGDLITAVNGTAVSTVEEVNEIKSGFRPGDLLRLTVVRNGENLYLDVEIRDQNDISG